jgi:hypothetical protein
MDEDTAAGWSVPCRRYPEECYGVLSVIKVPAPGDLESWWRYLSQLPKQRYSQLRPARLPASCVLHPKKTTHRVRRIEHGVTQTKSSVASVDEAPMGLMSCNGAAGN